MEDVTSHPIRLVKPVSIQLTKLSGFSPIITTASLKHAEYLKSIGATHVINRSVSDSDLESVISRVTPSAPIKYAVNSISTPDTQPMVYDLLAPSGQVAIFLERVELLRGKSC